jgi:hypothetical protein
MRPKLRGEAAKVSRRKYEELRIKRFKEREERFKRERERIEEQQKALERRKRAEAEKGRAKAKLEPERRRKARQAITTVKATMEEAEDKTKISIYAPEAAQEINVMLTEAEKSFASADYDEAIKLSHEIKELVEKAILEASRKAEQESKRRKGEAKYFYCIIPFSKEKSFGNIGLNNAEVYTIPHKDIAAVVSDSPMMDYELTEDNMRIHEAVLRRVMEEHTVVPVEFGTTIKNEKILRRLLTKAYAPARESLRLVDNKVELGVKAVLIEDTESVDPEKRKEYVTEILTSLKTIAKQAVTGDLFSDRLILNASFLVNREDIDAFSEMVAQLQEKYPMLRLLYSGPWAPYNFVYIKIGAEGMEIAKK